jgi:ATP-binding cassette subfamily B protein
MSETRSTAPSTFARLAGRLRRHRAALIAATALAVGAVALSVCLPLLIGHATDVIADGVTGDGVDFGRLGHLVRLGLALYAVASVLRWLQGRLLTGVVQESMRELRDDVEHKVHRLPLRYHDTRPPGDLLSRVTNDIDNLAQTLQQTFSEFLTAALTVVGVVVAMVVISPAVALLVLIAVPVSVLVTRAVSRSSQRHFAAQWMHTGDLSAHVDEAVRGHELINVFGRRDDAEAEFGRNNERLCAASERAQFVSGLVMVAMTALGNLSYIAVAVVGGLRVASGSLTLGEVQALIQYAREANTPMSQAASMVAMLQSGLASGARVFEVLDADEEAADPVRSREQPSGAGRVVFEDVSFRYDPDRPLLEEVSFRADPGQTVAIVGPTGAGKTTLVNLLMGFYPPVSGRITVDGVDLARLGREDLRRHIGMVLQDPWVFTGTIEENIRYGAPGASDSEVREASAAAFVDPFVRHLPDGYATVIGGDGDPLSAGERQLITIARALLADRPLLILDEATSSVDTRTEVLIQSAMTKLRESRTCFVIAHRLSTIRDADLILTLDGGRIVEQGTHEQLLARGGTYSRLHRSHFAAASTRNAAGV